MDNSNYTSYLETISEPSNRAAITSLSKIIESIEGNKYRSGTSSMHLLDQPYKTIYGGIVFKKWSSFLETFNEMVAKMEPNGLMEHWKRFLSFSTTKTAEIGPQVLTMDHLTLGFLACCLPLVLAFIAFIGELAWSKCVACRKSSNESNFEQKVEAISEIEVIDLNSERPEKEEEVMIEMCDVDVTATSRMSLEDSNEPQVETIFQIGEEFDGNAVDMCNFDNTAASGQIEPQVIILDDTKILIEESCVDNVPQGQDERDDIDDLIDQINFKPCVEIDQIV